MSFSFPTVNSMRAHPGLIHISKIFMNSNCLIYIYMNKEIINKDFLNLSVTQRIK